MYFCNNIDQLDHKNYYLYLYLWIKCIVHTTMSNLIRLSINVNSYHIVSILIQGIMHMLHALSVKIAIARFRDWNYEQSIFEVIYMIKPYGNAIT